MRLDFKIFTFKLLAFGTMFSISLKVTPAVVNVVFLVIRTIIEVVSVELFIKTVDKVELKILVFLVVEFSFAVVDVVIIFVILPTVVAFLVLVIRVVLFVVLVLTFDFKSD